MNTLAYYYYKVQIVQKNKFHNVAIEESKEDKFQTDRCNSRLQ
jgi:hypothetical protein